MLKKILLFILFFYIILSVNGQDKKLKIALVNPIDISGMESIIRTMLIDTARISNFLKSSLDSLSKARNFDYFITNDTLPKADYYIRTFVGEEDDESNYETLYSYQTKCYTGYDDKLFLKFNVLHKNPTYLYSKKQTLAQILSYIDCLIIPLNTTTVVNATIVPDKTIAFMGFKDKAKQTHSFYKMMMLTNNIFSQLIDSRTTEGKKMHDVIYFPNYDKDKNVNVKDLDRVVKIYIDIEKIKNKYTIKFEIQSKKEIIKIHPDMPNIKIQTYFEIDSKSFDNSHYVEYITKCYDMIGNLLFINY